MHVRCPGCRSPIDLLDTTELSDISCPSCGSHFNLIGEAATETHIHSRSKTIGHFELIEHLGIGHFGNVWMARDSELDRTVAIKIPRKGQLDAAETELFFREARAAAQLRHTGIVSVHEVGRDGDTLYIVTDYVHGITLADWLAGQQPTVREAAQMCLKIAEALHHAHEAGVIHRDVKPGNIMLDFEGEPHVTDFGLAKREAGELTMTIEGRVLGTPAYMPPEQARGEGHYADRRSDVYSLGVILFELLTGERPFRGNQRMLTWQIINEEPPSPRKLNGRVPRDMETICLKCLAKDPARRYATADALAADLRRFLAGDPIDARPISRVERLWRWSKRNPKVAALAAAFVLLLAIATVGSTTAAILIAAARDDAQRTAQREREARAEAEQAQQASLAAQRQAQTDAETARQVSQFLAGMFESSTTAGFGGFRLGPSTPPAKLKNLTAREILARGAARIAEETDLEPETRAALMDTIGNVYVGLGLTDEAEPLLEKALEIHRNDASGHPLQLASSTYSLSYLRAMQGRDTEAIELMRDALRIREKLLGDEHKDVIDTKFTLAFGILLTRGDAQEGENLMLEVLEWRRENLGAKDPAVAEALVLLALVAAERGDETRASTLLIEAAGIFSQNPETEAVGLIFSNVLQAALLSRFGNHRGAAPLFEKALATTREVLGEEHLLNAFVIAFAADSLLQAGRFDEAEELHRKAIDILQASSKGLNPWLEDQWLSLARLRHRAGDLEEAEGLFRRALAIRRQRYPEDHPYVENAVYELVRCLRNQADYDACETLLRERLAIRRDAADRNPAAVAARLTNLGRVAEQKGDSALAEQRFREAIEVGASSGQPRLVPAIEAAARLDRLLQIQGRHSHKRQSVSATTTESKRGADRANDDLQDAKTLEDAAQGIRHKVLSGTHARTADMLLVVGWLLEQSDKWNNARKQYEETLRVYNVLYGESDIRVADAWRTLARLHARTGEAERARSRLEQSIRVYRAALGERAFPVALAKFELASLMFRSQDVAAAEQTNRQLLKSLREDFADQSWLVAEVQSQLGACMTAQGKYDEAEPLLLASYEQCKGEDPPREAAIRQTLERIVEMYEKQGQTEAAARYRALLDAD